MGARPGRHDAERHHQGVPLARDLRLPARALAAADHRHGRLHGARDPEVEPDQHLQLPPAGGRGHAGAGDRLRDVARRSRSSTPCATRGRCRRRSSPSVVARISFFVNAGVRFVEEMCKMRAFVAALGRADPRALRRHRRQGAPLPLRRPGQQPGPDRGPAREQRPADRPRDAGGDALEGRAGAGHPAAGLERGARPAAAVGPAVEPADAAGARLRVRPARVRRPLRRVGRRRGQGRRARRGRQGRDGARRGDGRRGRRRRVRLHEVGARRLARRASPPDRVGRGTSSSASTGSRRPSPTR